MAEVASATGTGARRKIYAPVFGTSGVEGWKREAREVQKGVRKVVRTET
jgi:hypothetical protein